MRWAMRGAGLLGAAAAILVTPERVARLLRGGEPLLPIGVESLLAYRALALVAGLSLLLFAQLLPWLSARRDGLLESLGILIPLGVLSACALLKLLLGPEHPAYTALVGEDGIVEYATSASYFAAGVLAARVARGLLGRDERMLAALWGGLALFLVVVSLEEISWGQRLFGGATPELLEDNVQNEMNLHNLPLFQQLLHASYIGIGLFGALAWGLLGGRGPARMQELVGWLVPRSWLLGCFLPVALFYALFDFAPSRWVGADGLRFGFISTFDQEPAELLLSIGFLLFAAHAYTRLRSGPGAGDTGR